MAQDLDPRETQEWLESLDSVVEFDGVDRAAFLLEQLHDEARRRAVPVPFTANTPYVNTIPGRGDPLTVSEDEGVRPGTTAASNGGQYM